MIPSTDSSRLLQPLELGISRVDRRISSISGYSSNVPTKLQRITLTYGGCRVRVSIARSPPQASVVHKPTDFIYTVKLGDFPECVYIG